MFGLSHATVEYDGQTVLRDITLDVPAGQVVTVVGGDGAGKSTLLRAMVGRVALASGEIRTPDSAAIGYLPAGHGSWLDLTVAENIEFVGGIYGLRGAALQRRSNELLEAAQLVEARDRLSRQLSGGMRRKLGFSLAMVHQPALLVLDEPSTGLDPVSRIELWRLISTAAARGAAVLTTTTYLDEAERASHILALDSGRVVVAGEPRAVVAAFDGAITSAPQPVRRELAWRRGRTFHELWDEPPPQGRHRIDPDLEDVVIAQTLRAVR